MHFLVIILTILTVILIISLISVTVKYKTLKKTFRNHKKMLRSILKTINSVRYGNLYERVNEETFTMLPNFAQSINTMIESIVDREKMIVEYQNDLNKKIDVLKEVEELKEDFVTTLTHDLKVPILAEKNMLNFLLDDKFGKMNERQKEAVCHLKNSNRELVELVQIILETYKLNETKIDLNYESIDIKRLMEETIEEMKPISDSDDIALNFYPDFHEKASFDEFYIKRVFKNLILNAISFSNSGSKVDIAIQSDDKNVYVKITNYGKSIKKEEFTHVFDKYYTTAKKFRKVGTGLGLYLSDKIIKAHKGEIFIDSEESNFTTFTISLPK